MKYLLVIFIQLPVLLNAQESVSNEGIKFIKGLSWTDIQSLAKSQHKLIFIDCYTTWCVPCKRMETEVYTDSSIGSWFRQNFISVKVQIDTSKNDDLLTKQWYSSANMIRTKYDISTFPTYLFFSSSGEIVHRGFGYMSKDKLFDLSRNAVDPHKQYYTLLEKYKKGGKDYSVMGYLATTARNLGDQKNSQVISSDYIKNYLINLDEKKLYSKDVLEFIRDFTVSSLEKGFKFLFNHSKEIDDLLKDQGFVESKLDNIILTEEVWPYLNDANSRKAGPDWNSLNKKLVSKYGKLYAQRILTFAESDWYKSKSNWPLYTKNVTKYVKNFGHMLLDFQVNNYAWDAIFTYSNNKNEIESAIKWMENIVDREPTISTYIDTYANLLYKSGKNDEAIKWEEKAIRLDPQDKELMDTFNKMKAGQPTWKNLK